MRLNNIRAIGVLLGVLGATAACGAPDVAHPPESPSTALLVSHDFREEFDSVRTVHLRPTVSSPLVRISGVAVDSANNLVVSDVSEANVQVFDSAGDHLFSFGRRGRGPGEFLTPVTPQIDKWGRIHVVDVSRQVVSVFTSRGKLIKEVRFPAVSLIDQAALGPNGGYVILGNSGAKPNVLYVFDSTGALVRDVLPLARAIPPGSQDAPEWRGVRRPSVAVVGSVAYVVHTLLDSLWTIDLTSGATVASSLSHPGYQIPTLPGSPIQNPAEQRKWFESLLLVSKVATLDGVPLVAFSKGIYVQQKNTDAAIRAADGSWTALNGVPPIVGTSAHEMISLLTPSDTQVVFGIFRRKRR